MWGQKVHGACILTFLLNFSLQFLQRTQFYQPKLFLLQLEILLLFSPFIPLHLCVYLLYVCILYMCVCVCRKVPWCCEALWWGHQEKSWWRQDIQQQGSLLPETARVQPGSQGISHSACRPHVYSAFSLFGNKFRALACSACVRVC